MSVGQGSMEAWQKSLRRAIQSDVRGVDAEALVVGGARVAVLRTMLEPVEADELPANAGRQQPLASRPGRRDVGPVDEGDAVAGGEPLQVGDVLDQLLVSLAAEPEDGHVLERAVRFLPERPGDVGVDLAGLWRLVIDEDEPDRRLGRAETDPGHDLRPGLVERRLRPVGADDEVLLGVELAPRRSLVEEPEGRQVDPQAASGSHGRGKSPRAQADLPSRGLGLDAGVVGLADGHAARERVVGLDTGRSRNRSGRTWSAGRTWAARGTRPGPCRPGGTRPSRGRPCRGCWRSRLPACRRRTSPSASRPGSSPCRRGASPPRRVRPGPRATARPATRGKRPGRRPIRTMTARRLVSTRERS